MYLIPADFKKSIQTDNLNQVIGNDNSVLTDAITTAIEEASAYLIQKYDLTTELQDTPQWDITRIYQAGNRVYFNPSAFDATATYITGQYAAYNSNVYQAQTNIAAGPFNSAQWALICPQYQIFSAKPPYPVFNVYNPYQVGDQVFWKGKIYTCRIASSFPSIPPSNQYGYYEAVPLPNVFPDAANGVQYWGVGVAYDIPAGTDIQNTAFWLMGDNRSQLLVTYMVDIALYHVHSRIAPRNIPDLRVKRYDDAIRGLKGFAEGATTPAIPMKQPRQGGRIRYGGPIKNTNSY